MTRPPLRRLRPLHWLPALGLVPSLALAGPYPPAAGQPGSEALPPEAPTFTAWADGWTDYQPGAECDVLWQTPDLALGPATGDPLDIVSLGRGGRITLTCSTPITDGPGPDFAVFENAVSDTFLELAFVEVSSDGTTFTRFPAYSVAPMPTNSIPNLQQVDPTNVTGFASKYRVGFGTPFDLADLPAPHPVDLRAVRYIRLVDIPGDGSVSDAAGNPIYDPFPTVQSAGADIEALGILHAATWCTIAAEPGIIRVVWPTRTNRRCQLQRRTGTSDWESIGLPVAGDDGLYSLIDLAGTGDAWYRVRVEAGP